MGFIRWLQSWSRGQQKLRQLDNPNPKIRAIVIEALSWCLEEKGIALDERLLKDAVNYGREFDWKVKQYVEFAATLKEVNFSHHLKGTGTHKMLEQLGVSAEDIARLADVEDEMELMTEATTTVNAIIAEAQRGFGLEIKHGSFFQEWLDTYARMDIPAFVSMTKQMAESLSRIDNLKGRGNLLVYWFEER